MASSDLDLSDEELLDGAPLLLPITARVAEPASTFHPSVHADALDPSLLGFPPMLAYEIAMNTAPIDRIFEGYGLTVDDYNRLVADPNFIAAVAQAKESLKEEGMSFKIKAKLQAEELLKQSWKLIHDPATPHNVRADLIKSTMRWAGHEKAATDTGAIGTALQININLGDTPAQIK